MEMQRQRDLTFGSVEETKSGAQSLRALIFGVLFPGAFQILSHLKDSSQGYSLNLLKAGHGEGL